MNEAFEKWWKDVESNEMYKDSYHTAFAAGQAAEREEILSETTTMVSAAAAIRSFIRARANDPEKGYHYDKAIHL